MGKSESTDTSFRRTWDREEYAAKAAAREAAIKEEGAARADAKAQGKKYYKRASTPPDAKESESRSARLDVSGNVGKTMLVPAGVAAVGKKGRGAGFYCSDCDLTFKDNLQFVEHLNSRQHQINTGQSGEVRKATLEEVRERLAWLARKKREAEEEEALGGKTIDLEKRLEVRMEQDEREREEKRAKRREKRRKTEGGVGVKQEDDEGVGGGIIC